MNLGVEREFFAVAMIGNPDMWLFGESTYKACDHRWTTRKNPIHELVRGFYRLDTICVCTRCGVMA